MWMSSMRNADSCSQSVLINPKVSVLTVRVLEQLSALRIELIHFNYPSSTAAPTTTTPYTGSDGRSSFEVSGYYGKNELCVTEGSCSMYSYLPSFYPTLNLHVLYWD